MTNEEAIKELIAFKDKTWDGMSEEVIDVAIKALEQQPCEMTTEEYRQRMIQAFHNADTDELIAVCVLPTEKEFEHLEWLLKNHYKKAPCDDAISREVAIKTVHKMRVVCDTEDIDDYYELLVESFKQLPPVTQKPIECEDAISRQAVLDIDFKRIILTTAKPAEMIEQKVKALPPVTPQQKYGN